MLTILFFAKLRDELGCAQTTMALEQATSIQAIVALLVDEHPHWQQALSNKSLCFALNQETINDLNCLAANGDELAVFPPVTGG